VRRGVDGPGSAQFGAHPAIEVPEKRLAAMDRERGHAEPGGGSILTLRVLTDKTFPSLTRLSEQSPSQEANSGPLGKREKSGPISAKRVCAVST
jgi:hypothetical protein